MARKFKLKLGKLSSTLLVSGIVLTGCGGSGGGSNSSGGVTPVGGNASVSIDAMTSVPVINGSPTQGTLYIHNYSSKAASGLRFSLSEETMTSRIKSLLSSVGLRLSGALVNKEGFTLINPELCQSIPAGGYCAINFTTPGLNAGDRNNSLVKLDYQLNGKSEATNQVVNYEYRSLDSINGVNFSGGLKVVGSQGQTRHMVGYLYGGGEAGKIYGGVRLKPSSPVVKVKNGFIDGQEVAAGQVIAVEFSADFQSNQSQGVNIVPYWGASDKAAVSSLRTSAGGTSGAGMSVTLDPSPDKVNFLFGLASIMTAPTESAVSIKVTNNGNVGSISGLTYVLDGGSDADLTVTNNCTSVLQANAGNSCSFALTTNSYTPGSTQLVFKYQGNEVGRQTIIWTNDAPYPAVTIEPSVPSITFGRNDYMPESYLKFTVINIGKAPLENVTYPVTVSGGKASWVQDGSNCTNPLKPNDQCTISGHLTGTGMGNGVAYASAAGKYKSNNYQFNSLPLSYTVTDGPALVFTNTPITMTLLANGTDHSQQKITIRNIGGTTATIDKVEYFTNGGNIKPEQDPAGTSCNNGSTLASNASCDLQVNYGPAAADVKANESGEAVFNVTWAGTLGQQSITTRFNYQLKGNDSVVVVTPPSAPNIPGSGTTGNPYQSNAGLDNQKIEEEFKNPSEDYPMRNFNLDLSKLPYGLVIDPSSTCPTGSDTGEIPIGGSCKLILTVDRELLSKSPSGGSVNLNYQVPAASWTTPLGFYSQPGESTVYMTYQQPTITFSLSRNNGKFESTDLTMTATNAGIVNSLNGNVWAVNKWLDRMPETASDNCEIKQDYSVTCDLKSALTGKISYYMPTYLESSTPLATIPLQFSTATNEFASLTPAYTLISYQNTQPEVAKLIFIATNNNQGWTGSLQSQASDPNGVAGADQKCQTEAASKNYLGTYKAMLAANGVRRACLTPNCDRPDENLDWVMKPNTLYKNVVNNNIGRTNGAWYISQ